MTLEQLRKYDGTSPESEGRICVAVNGKIFDVSRVSSALDPDSLDPPDPGLFRSSDPFADVTLFVSPDLDSGQEHL
jgi:hypothetical protein